MSFKNNGNKTHERLERLVVHIRNKMEQIKQIPSVMADRVVKIGTLSFLMLILGCFFSRDMGCNFLLCSAGISLFGFFQSLRILHCAKYKEYEVIEGIVLKMKGRHAIGRFFTVTISTEEGKETQLLMDKRNRLKQGKKYRFYFSKKAQGSLSGIQRVDAALNLGAFYGYEEVE